MKERRTKESKLLANPAASEAARAYEEEALGVLRSAGYRITMPRVQVIRALADTKKALSAYAIHEKIVTIGGKIDVVSVYRILSTLQEVGLIHHVGVVDGYFPCRIENRNGKRSEVFVDDESGDVLELQLPEAVAKLIEQQCAELKFEGTNIKVEVIGYFKKA
jgi:Fe2+ or Zn2+ uptake regulation protein